MFLNQFQTPLLLHIEIRIDFLFLKVFASLNAVQILIFVYLCRV